MRKETAMSKTQKGNGKGVDQTMSSSQGFSASSGKDLKSLVGGKFRASDGSNYGIYVVGCVPEKNALVVLPMICGKKVQYVQYDEDPKFLDAFTASYQYTLTAKGTEETLVVYSDGHETLVCSVVDEPKLLEQYFGEGIGRLTEDYDRDVVHGIVEINSRMLVSGSRMEVVCFPSKKKARKKASKKACIA